MPASNDGFRHLDLRYMQIEISMDAAKNLPGHGLQDFFSLCEFVSHIRWDERSIECYLKVVYDDEKSLEIKHPSVTVIEVITKGENSALVKAKMDGPIPHLFSKIENVWWVHPTKLDMRKFTLSIRGTTAALRNVRNEFKKLVGNGFTVKLGAESLQGPEFKNILPQKQKLVLETAIQMGYYSRPRQCTQRDIAKALDIKQATVSEHLQSAEAKIINSFHN
tara:strand:+ start:2803 stop:3465 length:663 start_codon:yes stop_codon:yes gene_type:complete